jgi:hypothetical protein
MEAACGDEVLCPRCVGRGSWDWDWTGTGTGIGTGTGTGTCATLRYTQIAVSFITVDHSRSTFIVHRSSFIVHRSSFIVHRPLFIVHRSSFIVHRSPFRSPFAVHVRRHRTLLRAYSRPAYRTSVSWEGSPAGGQSGGKEGRRESKKVVMGGLLTPNQSGATQLDLPHLFSTCVSCSARVVTLLYHPGAMLCAVCCLLFAVCCLLFAVCCLLFAVCCLLFAVCCLRFAVCSPPFTLSPLALHHRPLTCAPCPVPECRVSCLTFRTLTPPPRQSPPVTPLPPLPTP